MSDLATLAQCIIDGDNKRAAELAQQALNEGTSPVDVLNQGLQAGVAVIGQRFRDGECFVPEVLLAARAMHAGLDVLRPHLADTGASTIGRVVIGTVAGDLHDIGKNLVGMMLEGTGFEVIDLGVDLSTQAIVEAVEKHSPDILGLSALITTTMPAMEQTIRALEEGEVRDRVKVIVGGAPVTREYASRIGADAYGADAGDAVDVCKALLGQR